MAGMSTRAAAMIMPGMILSHVAISTIPSKIILRAWVSMMFAINSRWGRM